MHWTRNPDTGIWTDGKKNTKEIPDFITDPNKLHMVETALIRDGIPIVKWRSDYLKPEIRCRLGLGGNGYFGAGNRAYDALLAAIEDMLRKQGKIE